MSNEPASTIIYEMDTMWEEAVVSYFEVRAWHSPGRSGGNYKQPVTTESRDSNPLPSEYKAYIYIPRHWSVHNLHNDILSTAYVIKC